jgi:hypothetical protein
MYSADGSAPVGDPCGCFGQLRFASADKDDVIAHAREPERAALSDARAGARHHGNFFHRCHSLLSPLHSAYLPGDIIALS